MFSLCSYLCFVYWIEFLEFCRGFLKFILLMCNLMSILGKKGKRGQILKCPKKKEIVWKLVKAELPNFYFFPSHFIFRFGPLLLGHIFLVWMANNRYNCWHIQYFLHHCINTYVELAAKRFLGFYLSKIREFVDK